MNSLAPSEPYVRNFEARVEHCNSNEVVLKRTYFYAESGGQPADRGVIDGTPIADVQVRGNEIVHTLAEDADIDAGETVTCTVDSAFRTYCMRAHTASHVLYGAGRRLLDDLGYGGFGIDERKIRIDFETSTEIDDDTLVELERLANRAVWESRPVTWETVPVEEARTREGVAFNTKTEEGVFGEDEGVRIVTVGGDQNRNSTAQNVAGPAALPWDAAACGGTHVSNTREIGPVTVLDRSNPGEGLTRVELAVGPTAIEHQADTHRTASDAANTLGVGITNLPDAVERQRQEIEELRDERDELQNRIADAQLDAVREEIVERDGEHWLVGTLAGIDSDTLADHARALAGEDADVVALVTDNNPVTIAVASADETDASALVDGLTGALGGGGGGGPEFAQGGGIAADPDEVVAFLREP